MISVIVSTYNREKYLVNCLNSVVAQNASKEDWELIIVNNKSTDSTAIIIKNFVEEHKSKNVLTFLETNQGLSYARNRGVKEASGNYFVFIDDDAFLDINYIKELKTYLNNYNNEMLAFGGKIKPFLEAPLPNWMTKYLMPLMSVIDLGNEVKLFKNSKYPIGANMGFSKALLDKVGLFNVKLGRSAKNLMGGEEKDLFFRIKELGAPIYYFPNVFVHHVIPESRLNLKFIKNQALGIGISEKIRTKNEGTTNYIYRIIIELYKWIATIFLSLLFLIKIQPAKSKMLIKFRYWVSKGLLLNIEGY